MTTKTDRTSTSDQHRHASGSRLGGVIRRAALVLGAVLAMSAVTPTPASAALAWAPCGAFDDNGKVVKKYDRFRADTAGEYLVGGLSDLDCGSSNYGYRHIVKRHLHDWEVPASATRQNWREVADFAIGVALRDPDRTSYRSRNDTFCFQRSIYLVDKVTGRGAGRSEVAVVVARVSKNIITAFPGSCPRP